MDTLFDAFSVSLNPDQEGCIGKIQEFLDDPDQRVFILRGSAGTGKTFLIRGLSRYLMKKEPPFYLSAYTGRATKILRERTGIEGACTLHKLIYEYERPIFLHDEDGDVDDLRAIGRIKGNADPSGTVYIVDEASLISDKYADSDSFQSGSGCLLSDFVDFVQKDLHDGCRKMIFIGDPSQLPPVNMDISPALDAAYFEKFGIKVTLTYRLEMVVRQAEKSLVLKNAEPLDRAIRAHKFPNIVLEYGEGFREVHIREAIDFYIEQRQKRKRCIFVVDTNRKAYDINISIRERIFTETKNVNKSDLLLNIENKKIAGTVLYNGDICRVERIVSPVEDVFIPIKYKSAEGDAVRKKILLRFQVLDLAFYGSDGAILTGQSMILHTGLFQDEFVTDRELRQALLIHFMMRHPDLPKKGKEYELVLKSDIYFNALKVRFAYALTCHKAQGGEWNHVIVYAPDTKDPRRENYYRWLYTALTRASEAVHIINPPRVKQVDFIGPFGRGVVPPVTSAGAGEAGAVASVSGSAVSCEEEDAVSDDETPVSSMELLAMEVERLLIQENIEVESIEHNQYQEAFYIRYGQDTARLNVSYNGKEKIGAIKAHKPSALANLASLALQPLKGRFMYDLRPGKTASCASEYAFLQQAYERLKKALSRYDADITAIDEKRWMSRLTVARKKTVMEFDLIWNAREHFKCRLFQRARTAEEQALGDIIMECVSEQLR